MATGKKKVVYICTQCGYEALKWYGKCPDCGTWNSLEEQARQPEPAKGFAGAKALQATVQSNSFQDSGVKPRKLQDIDANEEQRYHTGLKELDRVLGGGIVIGSLILVGGDPGIGKSTLMLQICQHLGEQYQILYVSGEESERQLKLRAGRLGVTTDGLSVIAATDMESILSLVSLQKPDIVIIDSIQTMNLEALSSSTGSVTQVRECTQLFARAAKTNEIPIFLIGHVNKEGAIAGPKILEHMVDAVLYFEGDKHLSYRILRAVKNRYGSTNEIGVFEMLDKGLEEVENPSAMLLNGRPTDVSGSCVSCIMEGSRPLLAEVQALVSKSSYASPRRMTTGFDYNRLSLLLAVLEKRAGFFFGNLDAYVNIVGGLQLDEPAADLPIALSLVSAYTNRIVEPSTFSFGEIGLTGEVRSVSFARNRVIEAQRMGFQRCILPLQDANRLKQDPDIQIKLLGVPNLGSIVQLFQAKEAAGG